MHPQRHGHDSRGEMKQQSGEVGGEQKFIKFVKKGDFDDLFIERSSRFTDSFDMQIHFIYVYYVEKKTCEVLITHLLISLKWRKNCQGRLEQIFYSSRPFYM